MDARPHDDPALRAWLDGLLTGDRLVDLCEIATHHYFHPEMKGWVSLKAILPAVWPAAAGLHSNAAFAGYYQVQDGRVLDPYATLPPLPFGEGGDTAQVVREAQARCGPIRRCCMARPAKTPHSERTGAGCCYNTARWTPPPW